jgi:hypothetical protein
MCQFFAIWFAYIRTRAATSEELPWNRLVVCGVLRNPGLRNDCIVLDIRPWARLSNVRFWPSPRIQNLEGGRPLVRDIMKGGEFFDRPWRRSQRVGVWILIVQPIGRKFNKLLCVLMFIIPNYAQTSSVKINNKITSICFGVNGTSSGRLQLC